MLNSKRSFNSLNIWPGYVDVLATLLIVTIFTIMISTITQLYFNDVLGEKKNQITRLDTKIAEIGELLSLEKTKNEDLNKKEILLRKTLNDLEYEKKELLDEKNKNKLQLEITQNKIYSLNEQNEILLNSVKDKNLKIENMDKVLVNNKNEIKKNDKIIFNLENNIKALNSQISELNKILDKAEDNDKKNKVKIKNLGKKLNLALAGKVQELSQFQSIFLKKIKESIGNRADVIVSGDRFIFPSEIFFKSGSDNIESTGEEQLQKIAKSLLEISKIIPKEIDWVLRIDGHTDSRPISNELFSSNWHLSSARAIKIVNFLINSGLPPKRLVAAGFGEYSPLINQNTNEAFRKNRRIEIKLTNR